MAKRLLEGYNIIRNIRGNWPNWTADLDDGRFVFVYVRYGEVRIGIGATEGEASSNADQVNEGEEFSGVTDAITALQELQKQGMFYVCPNYSKDGRQ